MTQTDEKKGDTPPETENPFLKTENNLLVYS